MKYFTVIAAILKRCSGNKKNRTQVPVLVLDLLLVEKV